MIICLIVAGGLIGAFYGLGREIWSGTEEIWEAAFSLFATIVISIMGAALLRVSKLQDKWRKKLSAALAKRSLDRSLGIAGFMERNAMFFLPFITVLREGIEAIVFVAGVSFSSPASAFPLPVITGLAAGIAVGYIIYK